MLCPCGGATADRSIRIESVRQARDWGFPIGTHMLRDVCQACGRETRRQAMSEEAVAQAASRDYAKRAD